MEQCLSTIRQYLGTTLSPPPLLFLPMCGYMDGGTDEADGEHLKKADFTIALLQKEIEAKRIIYVATHPFNQAPDPFRNLISNTRRLHTDRTIRGSHSDIVIPVSTTTNVCNQTLHAFQISNIVFSCGGDHSRRYKGLRSQLPRIQFLK